MNLVRCSLAPILLFLAVPFHIAAQELTGKWENEIRSLEAQHRTNPVPKNAILFIGSSSIRLWKTLAQDFPEYPVINHGFGGSEISDSVYYANRLVVPLKPKLVVLYAGGNDIHGGKSPETVLADFKAFVAKVKKQLPGIKIAYISIAGNPARWSEVEKVKAANALISDFVKQTPDLEFINIFPLMLGEDGQPRAELFGPDRLHMSSQGYAIWTDVLRKRFKEWHMPESVK